MKAFTNYFSSNPADPADSVEVEVLSYDRNKYCYVRVPGCTEVEYVKRWHLYADVALTKGVRDMKLLCLPTYLGGPAHTRKQAAAYKKWCRTKLHKKKEFHVWAKNLPSGGKQFGQLGTAIKFWCAAIREDKEALLIFTYRKGPWWRLNRRSGEMSVSPDSLKPCYAGNPSRSYPGEQFFNKYLRAK